MKLRILENKVKEDIQLALSLPSQRISCISSLVCVLERFFFFFNVSMYRYQCESGTDVCVASPCHWTPNAGICLSVFSCISRLLSHVIRQYFVILWFIFMHSYVFHVPERLCGLEKILLFSLSFSFLRLFAAIPVYITRLYITISTKLYLNRSHIFYTESKWTKFMYNAEANAGTKKNRRQQYAVTTSKKWWNKKKKTKKKYFREKR